MLNAEKRGAYSIMAPHGVTIDIDVDVDEAADPYPKRHDAEGIRSYYDREGYVVVRGLMPADLCDRARAAFEQEVKPYSGYIYRQATSNPERNVMTDHGFMINSIQNVQSMNRKRFGNFRAEALEVLTHKNLQRTAEIILGEPGKIVQTMYFEGNKGTWAHQDSYYLDAAEIGRMTGAWIAVEDIAPGAGRFYVYPRSHLIDVARHGGDFDIAFHHDRYKDLVLKIIDENSLECRAPAMRKGDVLFWAAKTIHGSLETTQPEYSRSSFTAHIIPKSSEFLQFQTRIMRLDLKDINGILVHSPKDLNKVKNQAILFAETTFPKTFQFVKRLAIKALVR